MALKVIEGFDTYNDSSQVITRAGFLQWTRLLTPATLVQGRFTGAQNQALNIDARSGSADYQIALYGSFAANMGTVYIGFAMFVPSTGSGGQEKVYVNLMETAAAVEQIALSFNGTDGSITTPFGRTTNNQFANDTWIFVEIGVVCSKTAGRLTIRINGVAVVDIPSVNTSPGTNQYINGIKFNLDFPHNFSIDDIYVCDSVVGPGAFPCNSFLGDRRVIALKPSAPGAQTGWTSSGGAANWVNAAVADGDVSYNVTSTVGAEDLFNVDDLPSTVVAVIGVQVTGVYKKGDGGSHTLTQRLYSNGTDAPGVGFLAPYALQSTYTFYSDLFMVDPATSAAWTLSAVNALQIGYKLET